MITAYGMAALSRPVAGTLVEEFCAVRRSRSCEMRLLDGVIITAGEFRIAKQSEISVGVNPWRCTAREHQIDQARPMRDQRRVTSGGAGAVDHTGSRRREVVWDFSPARAWYSSHPQGVKRV
jgi:hypothetical protein